MFWSLRWKCDDVSCMWCRREGQRHVQSSTCTEYAAAYFMYVPHVSCMNPTRREAAWRAYHCQTNVGKEGVAPPPPFFSSLPFLHFLHFLHFPSYSCFFNKRAQHNPPTHTLLDDKYQMVNNTQYLNTLVICNSKLYLMMDLYGT